MSNFRARDLGQDVASLRSPDEGLGVEVVLADVALDSCHELLDAAEDTAPDALDGDVAEEALDHVQPRRAGRREVHVEARVSLQPPPHSLVLVGAVVVGDHVDGETGRGLAVDHLEEAKPLLVAVPLGAHAEDLAVQRIHGGEQRRGAVALVVVRHGLGAPAPERQRGLRAVQGLDLRLLALLTFLWAPVGRKLAA